MAIHSAIGATKRASPKTIQSTRVPAPSGGMDGRVGLGFDDVNTAVYSYNILSGEYGMKVRQGYREYVTGCVVDPEISSGVRTLIPYEGLTSDELGTRLFAVTNEGIWNASTDGNVTPTLMIDFLDPSGSAGQGVFAHYISDAQEQFIYYADGKNGLFVYEEATDTWTIPINISGVDVSLIRFVVVHKIRIWFIEQASTSGWYLPIESVSGEATEFHFGAQFKHGGKLVGLYNWTVDGGAGIDDFLVAISNSGDVLPYKGSDPEATVGDLWGVVGVFFIGAVAGQKRCASEFGGDLQILSIYGLTAMSDLLKGVDPATNRQNSMGSRMALNLSRDMARYNIEDGWGITFLPSIGAMLINTPQRDDGTYIQYVYNLPNDSFGWWRDVPMLTSVSWKNSVYVGTRDGRVLVMDIDIDDVRIIPPPLEDNGKPIRFSVLFHGSSMNSPAKMKRATTMRPDFVTNSNLDFRSAILYDYDISEVLYTPETGIPIIGDEFAEWDGSLWDTGVWNSTVPRPVHRPRGATGVGRVLSVAIQGDATSNTWLIACDVLWTEGWEL